MITRSFVRKLPNVQMVQFANRQQLPSSQLVTSAPARKGTIWYILIQHTILYIEIIHESNVDN
jgi:hypothetical protein